MKSWLSTLLLTLVLSAPAVAEDPEAWGHRPFKEVEHWSVVLEDPARDDWQQPLFILDILGLEEGDVVAEIGAGTGYFTRFLSFPVGKSGRVYAVDVEPAMIRHLEALGHPNAGRIVPVLARPADPGLPAAGVDLVFVANTWHLIKKRPAYLEKISEAMTPEGRLVIIDFHTVDTPVGPPLRKRLARERVIEEFERAGWRLVAESSLLSYQYFLTFMPPRQGRVEPVPLPRTE